MKTEKTAYPGIYRRGEKYVATISYRDELGRSRVKWVTCSTLNGARRARRQTEEKLDEGIRPSDARMPLSEFLNRRGYRTLGAHGAPSRRTPTPASCAAISTLPSAT
jgi:hypothetical protein